MISVPVGHWGGLKFPRIGGGVFISLCKYLCGKCEAPNMLVSPETCVLEKATLKQLT